MAEAKTILVTGSSDGIGLETARQLKRLGHQVILHGRNAARIEAAREALGGGEWLAVTGDLSNFDEVKGMKAQVEGLCPQLDVLINNAGIYSKERRLNSNGLEMSLAVNHFGHMLLTLELEAILKKSPRARIVNVSSGVHRGAQLDLNDFSMSKSFSPYGAYAASKLANLLFTGRLVREPAFRSMLAFGLHPGVIGTKLLRQNFGASGASLESGAKTSVLCATASGLEKYNGSYFSDERPQDPSAAALEKDAQDELWDKSLKVLKPYLTAPWN